MNNLFNKINNFKKKSNYEEKVIMIKTKTLKIWKTKSSNKKKVIYQVGFKKSLTNLDLI